MRSLASGIEEWCAAPPEEVVASVGDAASLLSTAADVKYEAYRDALTGATDASSSPIP